HDAQAVARVHELRRDRRSAARDQRVGFANGGEQFVAFQTRAVVELDVRGVAQNGEPRFGERVGDENAVHRHPRATSPSTSSIASTSSTGMSPMWPMRNVLSFH